MCGKEEWRHVCASNRAQEVPKTASNIASNKVDGLKQRWDRKAYNKYQRMYVAVWRAVKAGRAMWLKKGERHEAA